MKSKIQIAALEANITFDAIRDAYRSFPNLHGNTEVLKLLVEIESRLDRAITDTEEAIDDAERRGYEEAESAASKNIKKIKKLVDAIKNSWEDLKEIVDDDY